MGCAFQQGGSPGAVCASGGGSAAHGTRNEGSVTLMYHSHLELAYTALPVCYAEPCEAVHEAVQVLVSGGRIICGVAWAGPRLLEVSGVVFLSAVHVSFTVWGVLGSWS